MSRQIIVLTAALAVHTAAVVVVAKSWDSPPAPAPAVAVAAPVSAPEQCQTVALPPSLRAPRAPEEAMEGPPAITDADLEAGIHMSDATHGMITGALYDKIIANPMSAARSGRIVPATRDGRPDGFKLYAIRPGSLLGRLHFQNGDTIQTVNGADLSTPDKALTAYQAFRQATSVDVGLIRKGTPLTISIALVGITPAFLDANITRTDDTHVYVSRAALALALAKDRTLITGARVIPSLRDNHPEGLKVYAIQPGSVAARLGFEDGDTLTAVNHLSVVDDSIPLARWTALGTAPELDLAITRHGAPVTLVVTPD